MKRVLCIAYHFPPCAISSGIQRTLSFAKHLPAHDWLPVVLTANEGAYERIHASQLQDIPPDVPVARAFALDAARHLAVGGRYWSRLTIPDRWRTWWLSAVPLGLRLIKQHRIDAIWSTYPIATAHSIGATLARLSGLPWVADFRDPMVEYVARTNETFPKDPLLRNARLHIEALAAKRARRLVFCTDAARAIVAERYPAVEQQRLAVISNGYEDDAFLPVLSQAKTPLSPGRRVLVHSGTIYLGTDRDPTALFGAIKRLTNSGVLTAGNFELRLRDPSSEARLRQLIAEAGLENLVKILPPISYGEALAEMTNADGLLLLQGYTSNPAVPAKLYEYARANRPILGLVDAHGETATTLRTLKVDSMADITDGAAIAALLEKWIAATPAAAFGLPDATVVDRYSRRALTARLATVLNEIA